jgi:hypothetical protein
MDIITSLYCTANYYFSASVDGNIKVWDNKIANKFILLQNIQLSGIDNLWDIAVAESEEYILAGGDNSCLILKK